MPRTLSAKKLEVPVKRILTGTPMESAAAKGALVNPESLAAFVALAQQRAEAKDSAHGPMAGSADRVQGSRPGMV